MELLRTKLFIPASGQSLVTRRRLLERLNSGLGQKLTLLTAPAGFGKTTLLSEWARQADRPVAWLSLGREDDEGGYFWSYFIAALHLVHPTCGENILAALQSPEPPPLNAVVTAILNEMAAIPIPWMLILDDYHAIQSDAIHQSLSFLIDHLPPQFHLVIATREDPPLSLSRWRGRRELSELRVMELRFTPDEIGQFFNSLAGLELATDDLATLESRTEGWVVGLQMAAVSLRSLSASEKKAFITAFSGNDRHIVDYLVEEVLHRQPDYLQLFLLQTSVLDRLCGPLCNALTGRTDSQTILAELERTNLFIVSLDNERCWYRYHHLFADLLRRRLVWSVGPQEVEALYKRASSWFEHQGMVDQAVSYALASNDDTYAADLIERHVLATFYRSETLLVHNWLKALPAEELVARPLLCAVYASTNMLFSFSSITSPETLALVETWLRRAEAGLAAQPPVSLSEGPTGALAVHYIDKVRAYLARFRGDDLHSVIDLTLQALARLPDGELMFRSALTTNLGMTYAQLGDHQAAQEAFSQAIQAGIASHDLFNVSAAWCGQTLQMWFGGHLREAADLCHKGLQSIASLSKGQPVPYVGVLNVVLGSLWLDWGEFEEAERELAKGLASLNLTCAMDSQRWGYCEMATVSQAKGNMTEALDWLDRAARILPQYADGVNTNKVRVWLKEAAQEPRYMENVLHWAQGRKLCVDSQDTSPNPEQLTLARVLLARFRIEPVSTRPALDDLQRFLDRQLVLARQSDLLNWQLDILVLQALTWHALDDLDQAAGALHDALRLAEPEGFVRVFWEAGASLVDLLRRASWPDISPDYLDKLLSTLEPRSGGYPAAVLRVQSGMLAEPLSAREIEIVRLMAEGDSNSEIAQKLCISLSTVKTHINHIFSKLGATKRTQAVAQARRLGLTEK